MTKIRIIFKRADRGKHWTSKQTRSGVLSFWSDVFGVQMTCLAWRTWRRWWLKALQCPRSTSPAGGNRGWNCSGANLQLARVCQPCLQAVAWHQAHGTFWFLRRSSRYGVLQNDHRWCRGGEAAGYIQQQVNRLLPMPNVLLPTLLSRERQQYLFNNIREYIREDARDVVCPKTLLSLDILSHGSQGL